LTMPINMIPTKQAAYKLLYPLSSIPFKDLEAGSAMMLQVTELWGRSKKHYENMLEKYKDHQPEAYKAIEEEKQKQKTAMLEKRREKKAKKEEEEGGAATATTSHPTPVVTATTITKKATQKQEVVEESSSEDDSSSEDEDEVASHHNIIQEQGQQPPVTVVPEQMASRVPTSLPNATAYSPSYASLSTQATTPMANAPAYSPTYYAPPVTPKTPSASTPTTPSTPDASTNTTTVPPAPKKPKQAPRVRRKKIESTLAELRTELEHVSDETRKQAATLVQLMVLKPEETKYAMDQLFKLLEREKNVVVED
jgi:hypothetical protein